MDKINQNKTLNINNYIDLSNLPKHKNRIDWVKSAELKSCVNFSYDGINGTLEILDYDKTTHHVKVKYNDEISFTLIENIRNCHLGKILRLRTSDFRAEIGEVFEDENRNLTIVDRFIKRDYNAKIKCYKYKCNVCGYIGEMSEPFLMSGKQRCSCCENKVAVYGINDITTTDPWMINYFQGGIEEAKQYVKGTTKMIYPKCPYCGNIHNKLVPIRNIYRFKNRFCNYCNENISYPEKYIFKFLSQILKYQDIVTQLNKNDVPWINNFYRYDFYIKSENIIIEAHGNQHYSDKTFCYCGGLTLQEVQTIDEEKKKLALSNNIKNYIVLDCRRSDGEWIKNSIMNSSLPKILNFTESDINWVECEDYASSRILTNICNYINDYPWSISDDIALHFGLSITTARKYIKKIKDNNLCKYEILSKRDSPILFINNNTVYKSYSDFSKKSNSILGYHISQNRICKICKKNNNENEENMFIPISKEVYYKQKYNL